MPVPRDNHRNLSPIPSNGTNGHDTGITLSAKPRGLIIVALTGNIRPVATQDSERASSEFYFAAPSTPGTAKRFSELAAGDKLMFNYNGGPVEYDLEADDNIDIYFI